MTDTPPQYGNSEDDGNTGHDAAEPMTPGQFTELATARNRHFRDLFARLAAEYARHAGTWPLRDEIRILVALSAACDRAILEAVDERHDNPASPGRGSEAPDREIQQWLRDRKLINRW